MGKERLAGVAQLVEQLICNQQVGGSNPFSGSFFEIWVGSQVANDNRL